MRVFAIDNKGKIIPFKEYNFSEKQREGNLEDLLEKKSRFFSF